MESKERSEPANPFEVGLKVPEMRRFIVQASKRLDEDCYMDKDGTRRVEMVVEKGELSHFSEFWEPGPFKLWVGLGLIEEHISCNYTRINDDEETVGGSSMFTLPRLPEDLDEATLPLFDPHYSYSGTVSDWQEMQRWVKEGQVVKPGYMMECYRRAMEKLLGIKAQKAS